MKVITVFFPYPNTIMKFIKHVLNSLLYIVFKICAQLNQEILEYKILTPEAGKPCTATRDAIFSSNHYSSAISWNIFKILRLLLMRLYYYRLYIHFHGFMFLSSVISICSTLSK